MRYFPNRLSFLTSQQLWQDLQDPPPRHWARSDGPKSEQTALVLTFALSALALISGVILSTMVVYATADRGARARENGTFDLLAVIPAGGFGASWAIFGGYLHYSLTLRTLRRMRVNAVRAVVVVGVVTLLPVLIPALEQGNTALVREGWSWLLFFIFLVPMMLFDYQYAVVSGGLIGILAPTYTGIDARVAAIFTAVMLHLTGYLIAAVTGALMLPVVYESLAISGWLADLSRPVLALLVFILYHEAGVLLLYRTAQERLNGLDDALSGALSLHSGR